MLIDDKSALYWASAAESVQWMRPWEQLVSGEMPHASWFVGGQLNVSVNCLDRHLEAGLHKKTAIIWESEQGEVLSWTYEKLSADVQRCANVLRSSGVSKGDRVTIYMGLVPEAVVAMLACARIGAIHSVVFGGFGADALATRVSDAESCCIITCDAAYRRGKTLPLKENVDKALKTCATVKHVLVVDRTGSNICMEQGRDLWWHEEMSKASEVAEPVAMDSEDIFFILHTSGTTGKPKGIVHTTAGYLVGVTSSFQQVFQPQATDIYWCTADIGWITGHSYVVYGPLANGATIFLYEGALDWPDPDRVWSLCAKHKITIFYTAPTAIRSFMKSGFDLPQKHDLSHLRLLGSVGEPINPEAWQWYKNKVGHDHCPIMDTWWQTETGMIMIAPPCSLDQKPGAATQPLPGVDIRVVDQAGQTLGRDQAGFLVISQPWPSMLRGIWHDEERYLETYWKQITGSYFTHDRAKQDADGHYWILGRADDMLIVSGHNLSNAEIEASLGQHPSVVEAAVVGIPDEIAGQKIIAFVIPHTGAVSDEELVVVLKAHVGASLSPVAKPKKIFFVSDLPKTRSGKIIRRLLRALLTKEENSDITTLTNPEALAEIKNMIDSLDDAVSTQ
ncbi:MAG: acetate--CoA ligase [Patescibacteria group bacterium]|jgi:acetyl-CoA synthetase